MSVAAQRIAEQPDNPPRILIVGSNLLAGALANVLEAYGFATAHVVPQASEVEPWIEWRPNLVILAVRSLDLTAGSALIDQLRRMNLVCIIDEADDLDRLNSRMATGTSAVIDGGEPLDQFVHTVNRLLRRGSLQRTPRKSSPSVALTYAARRPQDTQLLPFAELTVRESVVLAELMEGHCAEEIARTEFVSISTVRSQIKAILQKLGVSSQLAAVALARRANWSLDSQVENSPNLRVAGVHAPSDLAESDGSPRAGFRPTRPAGLRKDPASP